MRYLKEVELLLGLSLVAKETNNDPVSIIQKANELNKNVTPALRKDIIVPIIQSANPGMTLNIKSKKHSETFQRTGRAY